MTDAVRAPAYVDTGITNVHQVIWSGLDSDDSGVPVKFAKYSDKTVQIYGTFGAAGSVTLQGSNDPRCDAAHPDHANAVYSTLTDPQANAITKTSAAIEEVLENPLWIRPLVTGGDGTTSITVNLVGKKTP